MSKTLKIVITQPNDPTNLHLLAIKQNYRRSSAGPCLSPCQEIIRIPSSTMDNHEDVPRRRRLSLSPCGDNRLSRRSSDMSGDISLLHDTHNFSHSRSLSPSSCSETSIMSCSKQIADLDALIIELQRKAEDDTHNPGVDMEDTTDWDSSLQEGSGEDNGNLTSSVEVLADGERNPLKQVGLLDSTMTVRNKLIGDVQKEKILNDCKNQIKNLIAVNKSLEKEMNEMLNLARAHRVINQKTLKCWPRMRACVQDLNKKLSLEDDYVEPSEIIAVLLESEKRYVTALTLLTSCYQQPMRLLASFKPDILSMQQLNTIFLNCTELLVIHRGLYEDLLQIPLFPETTQVDKLFEILERTFPAFGHYSSYQASNRQQTIQKELKLLKSHPEFEQLLDHCQQNCEGLALTALLTMPTERMSEYSELLTHFLNPRVRALPEDATKRAEALIRFLRNLRYSLSENKSEWDQTQEKIKLMNKLSTDGPIPLEIFNSDNRLMKQGPLTQVVGKKENAKHCILFNNYIALAQIKDCNHYRIMENGMMSLCGAQLHKCVDVEGQAIGSDLQSGRSEDRLAFRLSLVNNESLYLRAAKPNEWRQWVEVLEKCIQESRELKIEMEMYILDHSPLYPVDAGPKIAAASLEKLFQQLTNPHFELHQDFMRVFLLTHSYFTTPKDVLTALLNCIRSPDDMSERLSQVSDNEFFLFNMPLKELTRSSVTSPCISSSTSSYTVNARDSGIGSPSNSPCTIRRSVSAAHNYASAVSPSTGLQCSTARKAVHSSASFMSTSDSDVSPHASAGWTETIADSDMDFKKTVSPGSSTSSGTANNEHSRDEDTGSHYAKLYPRSRVDIVDSEDSDREEGDDRGHSPRMNPYSRLLNKGDTDSATTYANHALGDIERYESKHHELDDTYKMLVELTESFSMGAEEDDNGPGGGNMFQGREIDSCGTMSSIKLPMLPSLSTSVPDIRGCMDDDDLPPSIPPDHPNKLGGRSITSSLNNYWREGTIVRHGSEHNLTSQSITIAELPGSKFHKGEQHGNSILLRRKSLTPMAQKHFNSDKDKKTKSLENPFRSKKNKKGENLSIRGTPPSSVHSSPAKSSTMFFGGSPSHTSNLTNSVSVGRAGNALNCSGTYSSVDVKCSKMSPWMMIRSKMGKKFSRSSTMDEEEPCVHGRNRTQRSHSTPSIKKFNVGRSLSITEEDIRYEFRDGGGSVSSTNPRVRKSSTTQGYNLKMLSKIFAILTCWVEEYFEDFENNEELTQCLVESLENLIARTISCDMEHHRAVQLLDVLKAKMMCCSTPLPSCSFPTLLSRVLNIKLDILSMYDWEHPDKLMKGREIDLSRSLPRESFLKMMAEQLTLMEFSVYAVIQRKELLNCNWKSPDKEKLAPNVCRLIRRTNNMTSWVCTEILQRKTCSQRVMVIENFVQIANYCYKHNDLHCALNITIALGSACIRSLRHTWAEVDKKYRHMFEKLKDQMDYQGRCKKMRENLEHLSQETFIKTGNLPTALPYIGAYLDTIYTLEMASKTYNHDGLVNFVKMTKLAEMVTTTLQYQDNKFTFESRLEMMAYVTAAKRLPENDLYELSMTVEAPSN